MINSSLTILFGKQKNPTSLLDPMNYLMGRLPVSATGVLTTSNGVGRFQLESASVSSMRTHLFSA